MSGLPAKCRNSSCGYLFDTYRVIGGVNANVRISGMGTNCPKCGSMADIGDGTYQVELDQLTLINGPTLTRQMIEQLTRIAKTAKAGVTDAEALLAEVAEVSPELAAKLRSRGLPLFLIILTLVWLIKSVTINVTVDLNRLIDQAIGISAESSDPKLLESDPPTNQQPTGRSPSTWADQQSLPMSRQVRRQLERRSKKNQGTA